MPPDFTDPFLTLNYIKTAIAVSTFLISERLPVTVDNIKSYFLKTNIKRPNGFDVVEATNFIEVLSTIDARILKVLEENLDDSIIAFANCLKVADNVQEKGACDRRAERSVCDTLNRIMDRNDDELPSEYLEGQWSSFKCVRV